MPGGRGVARVDLVGGTFIYLICFVSFILRSVTEYC